MSNLLKCPICNSEAHSIYSLTKDQIKTELHVYYNELVPEKIELTDYEILRCINCTLEYALPLKPGSQSFYEWVTTRPGYYTESRWEWFAVTEEIEKREKNNYVSILDIGCGTGSFLEIARKNRNLRTVGLDTTPESINKCRAKGLEVYCDTIDFFETKFPEFKFDYVVSFHCLEHVNQPKIFVNSMLSLLKSGGSLFISTPYSPMSFEQGWFDIMNHPPHHITRWNKKAYDELACQLNCDVKYFMPTARWALPRAINTFKFSSFGRKNSPNKQQLLTRILRNPLLFIQILLNQFLRPKIDRRVTPDVVLVELKSINKF